MKSSTSIVNVPKELTSEMIVDIVNRVQDWGERSNYHDIKAGDLVFSIETRQVCVVEKIYDSHDKSCKLREVQGDGVLGELVSTNCHRYPEGELFYFTSIIPLSYFMSNATVPIKFTKPTETKDFATLCAELRSHFDLGWQDTTVREEITKDMVKVATKEELIKNMRTWNDHCSSDTIPFIIERLKKEFHITWTEWIEAFDDCPKDDNCRYKMSRAVLNVMLAFPGATRQDYIDYYDVTKSNNQVQDIFNKILSFPSTLEEDVSFFNKIGYRAYGYPRSKNIETLMQRIFDKSKSAADVYYYLYQTHPKKSAMFKAHYQKQDPNKSLSVADIIQIIASIPKQYSEQQFVFNEWRADWERETLFEMAQLLKPTNEEYKKILLIIDSNSWIADEIFKDLLPKINTKEEMEIFLPYAKPNKEWYDQYVAKYIKLSK